MRDIEINEVTVKQLASLANLPIESGREKIIAPQLREWITNANKLNEAMSDFEYQSLMPITTFGQKK